MPLENAPAENTSRPTRELDQFISLANIITVTMKDVASLAEKGVSTALLGIGGGVLVLSLLLKIQLFRLQIASIEPSEFIALIACSTLLILCGAGLRLYQYQKDVEISRVLADTGAKIIENSAASSARIQEKIADTGTIIVHPQPHKGPI